MSKNILMDFRAGVIAIGECLMETNEEEVYLDVAYLKVRGAKVELASKVRTSADNTQLKTLANKAAEQLLALDKSKSFGEYCESLLVLMVRDACEELARYCKLLPIAWIPEVKESLLSNECYLGMEEVYAMICHELYLRCDVDGNMQVYAVYLGDNVFKITIKDDFRIEAWRDAIINNDKVDTSQVKNLKHYLGH